MNESHEKLLMRLSGGQMAAADLLKALIATHPDQDALRAVMHAVTEHAKASLLALANSKESDAGIDGYTQFLEKVWK